MRVNRYGNFPIYLGLCSWDDEAGAGDGGAGGGDGGDGGSGGDQGDGAGAGAEGHWADGFPSEVKEWKEVKDSKDAEAFFANMGDMRSLIGNSVRIPGPDATPEAKAAFYAKIIDKVPGMAIRPDPDSKEQMDAFYAGNGRPDEVSGYKVPEGMNGEDGMLGALYKGAHKGGINQQQIDYILEEVGAFSGTSSETTENARIDGMTALRSELGVTFNDRNAGAVALLEKTKAPQGLIDSVKGDKVGAATLRWVMDIAKSMGENGVPIGDQGDGGDVKVTPAEAAERIAEIRANPAYWDKSKPEHAALSRKLVDLQGLITPGKLM